MPELVRRGQGHDARRDGVAPDDAPEGLARVVPAARRDEERASRRSRARRAGARRAGTASTWSSATSPTGTRRRLPPLPRARHEPALQVEVRRAAAPHELAHAQARGVHEVEHRRVAGAAVGRRVGRGEQALDLVEGEDARQLAARASGGRRARVGSSGTARSRTRNRKKPRSAESCRALERAPKPRSTLATMSAAMASAPMSVGSRSPPDVRGERVEVARVGVERVLRERALDPQVVEVGVDPALEVHATAEGRRGAGPARSSGVRVRGVVTPRQRAATSIAAAAAAGRPRASAPRRRAPRRPGPARPRATSSGALEPREVHRDDVRAGWPASTRAARAASMASESRSRAFTPTTRAPAASAASSSRSSTTSTSGSSPSSRAASRELLERAARRRCAR